LLDQIFTDIFNEHLPYEIDMLRETYRLIPPLPDGYQKNALIEAFCIHESWRRHYNTVRPQASLRYKPPAPEVFVPALVAWPATLQRSALSATLATDDDLGLAQNVEDLAVEQFVAQASIEAPDVTVFPRATSVGANHFVYYIPYRLQPLIIGQWRKSCCEL
jgi:hypothetical protein